ncbi:MAG: hypothetical protein EKK47_16720 [Burkholderiales bacterium]|nr:MAG: hypothetical protein EKK47_16720 [Burkholderiales bacterium]
MGGLWNVIVRIGEPLLAGFIFVVSAALGVICVGPSALLTYAGIAVVVPLVVVADRWLDANLDTMEDTHPIIAVPAVVLPGLAIYGVLRLFDVPYQLALFPATCASALIFYGLTIPPPDPAPPSETQRVSGAYGDAGWATLAEIEAHDPPLVLRSTAEAARAVVLGSYANSYRLDKDGCWTKGVPLNYAGTNNVVTIGCSGCGKGTRTLIPTLATNEQSMFVLDVKGTLTAVTAWRRRWVFGHRVLALDPFGIARQLKPDVTRARYNPFAELADVDPCGDVFQERIASLCNAVIRVEGNDPHWPKGARDLTRCVMGYLASEPESIRKGHNTLPAVRDTLSLPRDRLTELLKRIGIVTKVPWVRNLAGSLANDSKEVTSFISAALRQLDFLDHPGIAEFLSGSDFSFTDLRRVPMTIYCVFGIKELDTYFNFGRLIVQSLFNDLVVPPTPDAKLPVDVVLDEQAKLRKMEIIETSVGVVREYGVRIWSVFQDLNQLKGIYGEAWETFLGNAGIVQVLGINDQTTAEYFSRRIGNTTVRGLSQGESWGTNQPNAPWTHNQGSSNSGGSHGVTEAGVPFLRPEQLYGLTGDFGFAFVMKLRYPVPCFATPYYEQPQLAALVDPNPFRSIQGA